MNSRIADFTNLTTWQKARNFTVFVYKLSNDMQDYTLKRQLRSAALSIMNNIAEGYCRSTKKDTANFLYMAVASCGEVRSMSYLMEDLKMVEEKHIIQIRDYSIELNKMLVAFINYLKT